MKRRAKGRSEDSDPIARWEAPEPPGWTWEAFETVDDDLFYGRVKAPRTQQQWEWGHFNRRELEHAGAIRVDSHDGDDQLDFGVKCPDCGGHCEVKLYEVELEAIY